MSTQRDSFYVGYLPMPKPVRLAVWVIAPLLLVGVVATAAILASTQDDPGPAVWTQLDESPTGPVELTGIYLKQPYPAVWSNGQLHLLVRQGKFNAAKAAQAAGIKHGDPIQATCYTLSRDGQYLYELVNDEAITAATVQSESLKNEALPKLVVMNPASQRPTKQAIGEVIDPKCYLGAMKPGDSVTHRACAILCLKGGIPPMLVDKRDETPVYYLLTDHEGNGIHAANSALPLEKLLPYVGFSAQITGTPMLHGNQLVFAIQEIQGSNGK